MTGQDKFPANPFEDIQPSDFNKLNKKHVTEDFVEENFKMLEWDVMKPFDDTGIDRIIIKTVCRKGHTKVNENLRNNVCDECGSKGIEIYRFVQVKTRALKNNIFGFTLKSKDIRIDPRHIYLLYSDNTREGQQDFLIISVKEFLEFFINNSNALKSPFASTSFRKGNNKLNGLKYNPLTDKWSWGRFDWEQFRNKSGLEKIQSPLIDFDLENQIIETRNLADKLQRDFAKGKSYSQPAEDLIKVDLNYKLGLYKNESKILKLREDAESYLVKNCDEDTIKSMNKYFEDIKTEDTIGEGSSDED